MFQSQFWDDMLTKRRFWNGTNIWERLFEVLFKGAFDFGYVRLKIPSKRRSQMFVPYENLRLMSIKCLNLHFEYFVKSVNLKVRLNDLMKSSKWRLSRKRGWVAYVRHATLCFIFQHIACCATERSAIVRYSRSRKQCPTLFLARLILCQKSCKNGRFRRPLRIGHDGCLTQ
jgi:hypothetical protein